MATSATWYDRLMGKSGVEAHGYAEASSASTQTRKAADYRLRPFPNDDIHFFTKRIDNSRVIREEDPQAPRACWKMIGGAGASAVLLIGMLLPSGYRMMAGYQIEELKKEAQRLEQQKEELELAESRLLSPERLAELAKLQEFVDPEPSRIVHLGEQAAQTALAMRRTPPAPARATRVQTAATTAATALDAAVTTSAEQPENQ